MLLIIFLLVSAGDAVTLSSMWSLLKRELDRLVRQRLAPDPIYEAYVGDAGITGMDNFDIIGNYCCG